MQYRPLGSSGLLVSPISLGTMTYGTPVGEADAIGLTHRAIDLGINFIDTANTYEGYERVLGSPGGVAEKIVGKALRGRRDDVVLATKVCSPYGPGPQDRGLSASHIHRALDRSLGFLQTDYIDLYIIHWPDPCVPIETTLAAMDVAVKQGKIRYFGVSNHAAWQLCRMLWLADRHGYPRAVSSQIPYSMLRREFHHDFQFCTQFDIGVTPYQALQGGLLTGKYKRGQAPPAATRAADKPQWLGTMDDALFDKLEAIEKLADEAGVAMAEYVMAWTLAQPAMTSLVIGATRIEQVEQAIAAADAAIPIEHFEKLDEICPPPWHQPELIRS